MQKFVDIETPYSAPTLSQVAKHIRYTRACVRDSLLKKEIPFASHLFYTQTGILDDNLTDERQRGIMAGKVLIEKLDATTVVYTDLGISKGMELGIKIAKKSKRKIEYRTLGKNWEVEFFKFEGAHSHNKVWLYESGNINLTLQENPVNLRLIKVAIENRIKELKKNDKKKGNK
ncbi:MAG: hypothetical protein ABR981_05820 [Candidatus Micrarchaeaceae archaeon]|jgi:hypothetical protein